MCKVWCVMVGIALFLPLWMLGQASPEFAAGALASRRDKSRPLLIFYPNASDRHLQKQQALFNGHEEDLKERDVVLRLVPASRAQADSDQREAAPYPGDGTEPRQVLRKRFHVEDTEFTVVLVGKDGGEKYRSHEPVTIEELDALIDAMPMRQQEVRDGHAK